MEKGLQQNTDQVPSLHLTDNFSHPAWLTAFWTKHSLQKLFDKPTCVLTSALDPVRQVVVVHNDLTEPVIKKLKPILDSLDIGLVTIDTREASEEDPRVRRDIWAQDTTEILCRCHWHNGKFIQDIVRLPGLRRAFQGMTKTVPMENAADALLDKMGIPSVLSVEPRQSENWIDWYGNVECSPPIKLQDGKEFPFGRAIIGIQNGATLHGDILDFLREQGLQWPPIMIDTSWLDVGHSDEVVNFVPSNKTPEHFQTLIPSIKLARTLLERCVRDGYQDAIVFQGKGEAETTVKKLLETHAYSRKNQEIEKALKETRLQLQRELGISRENFIEVPLLVRDDQKEDLCIIPNGVNGLTVNGNYIMSDPLGPVIGGKDVFFSHIADQLAACGVTTHTIDTWDSYHVRGGEIHCGTNAVRGLAPLVALDSHETDMDTNS